MNNFSPRQSGNDDVNLKTTQVPYGVNEKQPARVYNDPKKQINPSAFTTIKKEKTIKLISALMWMTFFVAALVALGIVLSVTLKKSNPTEELKKINSVGYFILIGLAMVVTLPMTVLNFIKLSAWRRTEQNYRHNYTTGDASAGTMFADVYKSVTLKGLRITWIFLFFLTYFGIFLIIVTALYYKGDTILGTKPSDGNASNFYIEIKWQEVLNNAFAGKTEQFLIISLIFILIISAVYAFVMLYDKKRTYDLKGYLGNDAAAVINAVAEAKRSENKAWLRMYIIVFILVVLLPLAVFIYLVYNRIIRRKK
ncbi:MSC_0882 family membrane protein [Mycoplasma buteonis]|uniref:MSC_0882 family membrane protein n=1 Tax=Mycoplasma buteonis TaxID=171280 RepID=UPI000562E9F7|nr:hypothetical protein [Mycoplasma buteonis]